MQVRAPRRFTRPATDTQRILIVGADPTQTLLLRRALEIDGYDVVDRPSGREAAAELIETPADLVLVNAPLSDGSTAALIGWIRHRPQTAHAACFVIAAPSMTEELAAMYDAGADLVITRPTELGLLSRKVAATLARNTHAALA